MGLVNYFFSRMGSVFGGQKSTEAEEPKPPEKKVIPVKKPDPVIYNNRAYVEDMFVLRKGRIGKIKKIDRIYDPPDVTVIMLDTNSAVGTELQFLTPCNEKGEELPELTPEEIENLKNKKKENHSSNESDIPQGIPETMAEKSKNEKNEIVDKKEKNSENIVDPSDTTDNTEDTKKNVTEKQEEEQKEKKEKEEE